MSIYVIGINHKTAPISLREKVYFPLEKVNLYLQDILQRQIAHEAVLLSTCNRSELYCEAADSSAVYRWFCEQAPGIEPSIYIYRDEEAVAHMMQVACGLDSMILGETQILGQMKAAFSESCSAGAINNGFHRLFQQVFSVAKEIRTATAIGACPVSVASACVQFAMQQFPQYLSANLILLGAGETAELLLRYLKKYSFHSISILNRNVEKAELLGSQYGSMAYPLDELSSLLESADIVISATGSPVPLINKTHLRSRQKPLLLIDVAVPRDIEPDVTECEQVKLFCIDDLKYIIEHNRQGREHAAYKAQHLIAAKSKEFINEHRSLSQVASTISAYRGQIEEICQAELLKAHHQLNKGLNADQVLNNFAKAFINKLMHIPSVQLRQAGYEGRFELLNFAKQLFAIPD